MKVFGPLHAQVIAPAVVVAAVRFKVLPEHTGLLLPTVGVAGVSLMVTFVEPAAEVQPLMVTVTLYVPVAAVVTLGIAGFCWLLVNAFGPLHIYVAAPGVVVLALRFNVSPLHTGELPDAVGVAGGVGSTKVTGPSILETQPFNITRILLYKPAARLGMTSDPLPLLANVWGACGVPPRS